MIIFETKILKFNLRLKSTFQTLLIQKGYKYTIFNIVVLNNCLSTRNLQTTWKYHPWVLWLGTTVLFPSPCGMEGQGTLWFLQTTLYACKSRSWNFIHSYFCWFIFKAKIHLKVTLLKTYTNFTALLNENSIKYLVL